MSGETTRTSFRNPHGPGRVYLRSGSRYWWVAWHYKGEQFRKSTKTTDYEKAVLFLERQRRFHAPVSVTRVLEDYLQDCELRGARAMKHLTRQANRAIEYLGDEPAGDIHPRMIYEFQRHLLRQGLAPATVNGVLTCVRAAFRLAARNGLISRRVEFPRTLPENNVRQGFFELADYRAILKELPEWGRDPFSFIYSCGWRRMEVLTLRWDEVDLQGRVIRLDPARSKNRHGRTLPFIGEIPAVIERRLAARIVGLPYVFHMRGRKLVGSSFNRVFRRASERAGRPHLLIHDCRRTAYRDLLRSGVLEKVAREIVGWRGTRMPDRYHIISERDLGQAAELYGEYLERKASEASARGEVVKFEKKKVEG